MAMVATHIHNLQWRESACLREASSRLHKLYRPTQVCGARAHAQPQAAACSTECTRTRPANHPGIMQIPASRHRAAAAHRHVRTGLQYRNGPKLTRGARAHTHSRKQQHQAHTHPSQHTITPVMQQPGTQQSRCSAQTRASGLAGAERAKTHSRTTRNTPRNLAASRGEAAERQR